MLQILLHRHVNDLAELTQSKGKAKNSVLKKTFCQITEKLNLSLKEKKVQARNYEDKQYKCS